MAKEVTFTVNKANVFTEVAKTTSYSGIKKSPDGSLYEQVFTTDEDRLMLERFWNEAANNVTDILKNFEGEFSDTQQAHGIDIANNYSAKVSLSNSFDTNLTSSIQSSLFSFFVDYIVGSWFKFINRDEASSYLEDSSAMLLDVKSKIYYKKKPSRTKPASV